MYYRGDEKDYGNTYKLIYVTMNKTVVNKLTCFKIPGDKDSPVQAQSILPDPSLFKVRVHAYIYIYNIGIIANLARMYSCKLTVHLRVKLHVLLITCCKNTKLT